LSVTMPRAAPKRRDDSDPVAGVALVLVGFWGGPLGRGRTRVK
jgi:hypothetical protein